MSNPAHHDNERESLSALFDGELHGDAARFALKRLDHDRDWREACGRWQLAGDVLRGRAVAVAPAAFAVRVAAALEEAPVAEVATTAGAGAGVGTAARTRLRWAGGAALAASVALAALFVSRPSVSPGPDAAPATPLAAAPVAAPVGSPASEAPSLIAATPSAAPDPEPAAASLTESPMQSPAATVALAGAAVAVAETPRRAAARRARAEAATTATIREAVDVQPAEPQAALAAIEPVDADTPRPFLPPGEITTRPWPRATLPDYPRGAFTASFGDADTPSPSFYPFEPERLDAGLSGGDEAGAWPRN